MPRLSEIQDLIAGTNLTPELDPTQINITGGYAGDMLSDVMSSAKSGQAWITIMKHLNIVAVASLVEIPAIIQQKAIFPKQLYYKKPMQKKSVSFPVPEILSLFRAYFTNCSILIIKNAMVYSRSSYSFCAFSLWRLGDVSTKPYYSGKKERN